MGASSAKPLEVEQLQLRAASELVQERLSAFGAALVEEVDGSVRSCLCSSLLAVAYMHWRNEGQAMLRILDVESGEIALEVEQPFEVSSLAWSVSGRMSRLALGGCDLGPVESLTADWLFLRILMTSVPELVTSIV